MFGFKKKNRNFQEATRKTRQFQNSTKDRDQRMEQYQQYLESRGRHVRLGCRVQDEIRWID